jgi:hypothetical protein
VMTTPGIPMLFMGQELLAVDQFSDGAALDWSRTNTYAGVLAFYRDLIRLRRNLDSVSLGLTGPNLSWHVVRNDAPWKLLAFHRWGAGPDDQAMVVMNFSNASIPSYWIRTWPENGIWYVNLNSDSRDYGSDFGNRGSSQITVSGGSGEIAIGPYSVLILSRRDLSAARNVPVEITALSQQNGNLTLTWSGPPGMWKVLQQATSVVGPWTDIYTNSPPSSVTNSFTIARLPNPPAYFRIKAQY